MTGRTQRKRWSDIETHSPEFVKGTPEDRFSTFVAQLAFPVVALAADARYAAVVCLSARFATLRARSLSFRDCASSDSRIALILEELERTMRVHDPATVVVEHAFHAQLDPVARQIPALAAAHARASGRRVRAIALKDAARIAARSDGATLQGAARTLLDRYQPLRERLAPDGRIRLRDAEHWRQHRALAAAYCLAHGAACEILRAAARTAIPPPTSHPAHGNPFT